MDKQLMIIANMFMSNLKNNKEAGLIGGKMGDILFCYNFSKYSGIKTYNDIADNLLDDVFNSLENIKTNDIEHGASGIAWGINYLNSNAFIDADKDIFDELESYLHTRESVDSTINFTFLSSAIYLQSKPGGKCFSDYDSWVCDLLNTCNYYCLSLYAFQKKPLDLINSILSFLIELKKHNIHTWEVSKLIWKLLNYLLDYKDIINDVYGDSVVLLKLLEQLEDSTPLKREVLSKYSNVRYSKWNIDAFKKILWQQLLFNISVDNYILPDVEQLLCPSTNKERLKEILVPLGLCLMNINQENRINMK